MPQVLYFVESGPLNKCSLYFLTGMPRIQTLVFKLEPNLYATTWKTILWNIFIGNCSAYDTAMWIDFNGLKAQKTLKLDQTKEILEQIIEFSLFFTFFYFYFRRNAPLKMHFENNNPGFLFKKIWDASKLLKLI